LPPLLFQEINFIISLLVVVIQITEISFVEDSQHETIEMKDGVASNTGKWDWQIEYAFPGYQKS
jgi:hypothetical protein